jgi:hypothetical protein
MTTMPSGAQLRRLTVQVKAIHEQNIYRVGDIAYEKGTVLTQDPKSFTVGWHAKQISQGDDLGIDFRHNDRSLRQFGMAVLREGPAAQTNHDNFFRQRFKEQKAHHRSRVRDYQLVRRIAEHFALNRHEVEMQRQRPVPLVDERLTAQKLD